MSDTPPPTYRFPVEVPQATDPPAPAHSSTPIPDRAGLPPLDQPVRIDHTPQAQPRVEADSNTDADAEADLDEPYAPAPPPSPSHSHLPQAAAATPSADISFDPPSATPKPPRPDAAPRLPKPAQPRVVAMMNQKGGVGKTTTTVSVGAALAEAGHAVLLIDLDPQAHLTLSLGFDPTEMIQNGDKTNYDLLADEDTAAMEVVRQVQGYDNLAVLPAETNLAGIESELADLIRTGLAQSILRNKCRDLFSQFDTILIDCPPSLGLLTINALTAASEIIVPMQAHFLALQGMTKLFETVRMVRQGINPNLTVSGVVLCMHEANTLLASEVIGDVEAFFTAARGTDSPWANAVVYQPPVRRNIKLAEAPSFGTPVHRYAPDSNGAADYRKLAASIAQKAPAFRN